jgi:PAS domain S-box-containing protein
MELPSLHAGPNWDDPAWQENRYRVIVEQQTEMVWCYLPDGTLTCVNEAYSRFFGIPREKLIGANFLDFGPPVNEDRETALRHIDWQVQHKTPRFEIRVSVRPNGDEWIMEWTDQAICDANGKVIEILAVGRDATQRVRDAEMRRQYEMAQIEQQSLQNALEKERQLSDMRGSLMRVISHEFRTPLAVIRTSCDIMMRYGERLTETQRAERFDIVHEQIEKMAAMLDDISLAMRALDQNVAFSPSPVNLDEICRHAIREVTVSIGAEHLIRYHGEHGVGEVLLDEVLINRLLMNLLSNAIKYSPRGSEINISTWRDSQAVMLRVCDQGIGIPRADLPHLFEPFYRGSNVGAVGGTGIGLSLIRECVSVHSGTISVESEEGVGTCFTIVLPQPLSKVSC